MALNSLLCADVPLSTYTLTRYDAATPPPCRSTSCRPVWLRKHIWRAEVSRMFYSATSTALSSTWKALIHRLGDLVCTSVHAHCQSPEPVSPHAAEIWLDFAFLSFLLIATWQADCHFDRVSSTQSLWNI